MLKKMPSRWVNAFLVTLTLGVWSNLPNLGAAQGNPTPTPFATARSDGGFQQLVPALPVLGQIERPNQRDRFALLAEAGRTFSVGVYSDQITAAIELYAPNGEKVAESQVAALPALIAAYTPPATGAYIVFVRSLRGRGSYSLWFDFGSNPKVINGGELTLNVPTEGRIIQRGEQVTFTFTLPAGTPIQVLLTPDPIANPFLATRIEITAPDGTFLTATTEYEIPLLYLPQTGVYRLAVSIPETLTYGVFQVTLKTLAPVPSPTFGSVTG
ncbi:MAG: hypothetical protein OHK0023_26380 [Anaerolineae bacterium]